MCSRKMRMRIIDKLAQTAGHTVAVSIAFTAGIVGTTITLVDNILDQTPPTTKPPEKKK